MFRRSFVVAGAVSVAFAFDEVKLAAQSIHDPVMRAEISKVLSQDRVCSELGEGECQKVFDEMMNYAESMGNKGDHTTDVNFGEALEKLMKREMKKMTELQMQSNADSHAISFLQAYKEKVDATRDVDDSMVSVEPPIVNPLEVPCFDSVSCKVLELAGSRCNFPRIATLGLYQAFNVPLHIVTVIFKLVCGCLGVGKIEVCILQYAPQILCGIPSNLFEAMWAQNKQLYESVKGMTRKCQMVGDLRVASPP